MLLSPEPIVGEEFSDVFRDKRFLAEIKKM